MEQNRPKEKISDHEEMTEENFLKALYTFMKQRDTPIERIPHLGFKQIDLFLMYKTVKDLGGYQQVTAQQLWKKVYNTLGGNPRSTSAATCTRRHYEKLLFPFECHQTGYDDDIIFRTPRPHKRFHSYSEFEQDYPRSVKRADFRHIPAFPQAPPNMFMDHQRQIYSLPLNITPYFPPGSTSLPNYIPFRDSTLAHLQDQPPRTPTPYLGESSAEVPNCKQPINWLRYLAKEYKSSAGWEEPLNLSRKDTKLDPLSDAPSSFGPPPSKKPKFLNEASPLYPPRGLTTEEGADQAETVEKTSKEEVLVPVRAESSPVSADVIDLTSSSGANPVPRRASPPSVHLFNRRANFSESLTMKHEQDQHPDWQKEKSTNMQALNSGLRSFPTGHQTRDSNGNMEIQIPLKLLQELIRRGLLSSPALSGNRHVSQDPPKADTPPEPKRHVRSHSETSESSTKSKEPEDLSFKSSLRNLSDTSHHDSSMKRQRSFSSTEELKPLSRSLRFSEDAPIPSSGTKSEKTTTSPIMMKDIRSSPPLLHVTDHLKFLLAHLPYRLERGPTF